MKFSKLNISVIAVLIGAIVFVVAQGLIPPGLLQVFGPYPILTCSDADGLNIYQQGFTTVSLVGTNGSTNYTMSGSDYCLDNQTVVEALCGSWVTQNFGINYNSSAFLISFNCSASNTGNTTYGCLNGACVPQSPTNNTNMSLPDLTVNLTINNVVNLSSNNTNSTSNIQFLINYTRTIKNIGNAASFAVGGIAGESMVCTSGGGGGGGGPISVPPLSPNQVVVQTLMSNVNCYGTWTATAIVDNTNVLPESNENNNNVTITRII